LGLKPLGGEKLNRKSGVLELSKEFIDIRNKELQNGRLAMIAVVGMIAQEEVNMYIFMIHTYVCVQVLRYT
jgi:hypothetical protein